MWKVRKDGAIVYTHRISRTIAPGEVHSMTDKDDSNAYHRVDINYAIVRVRECTFSIRDCACANIHPFCAAPLYAAAHTQHYDNLRSTHTNTETGQERYRGITHE